MTEIPISVYRVQVNHLFPLSKILSLLDYFEKLGVGFLYFSPITKARPGSLHGYDVIDFEEFNSEIGTEEELKVLSQELRKRGMGILLDIVPNHMSRTANKWWDDVEKNGKNSPYAPFFDIEWDEEGNILNFRRFFDISDLVSLRMEYPQAFEAVHRLPFKWLDEGWIQGLRIDHIDGLYFPQAYLEQVAKKDCYLLVEKILVGEEKLNLRWPVNGTTGYDFLNQVNGLFVSSEGFEKLRNIYANFCNCQLQEMEEVIFQGKEKVLETTLKPEVDRLNRMLPCKGTLDLLVHFPVYRTYITPDTFPLSTEDRHWLKKALDKAKLSQEDRQILPKTFYEKTHPAFIQFFQQVSGPAMAKGEEDTALYRYYPLASVNEVGMDPEHPGNSVERFHEQNRERLRFWPHTLLATSTHDTKRSEDVRARINVLSESPEEWETAIQTWAGRHALYKVDSFPDRSIEYLIYQTLFGTWDPTNSRTHSYLERMQTYTLKAIREAKQHTSWIEPNPIYEQAVLKFIEKLLQDGVFLKEMDKWFHQLEKSGKQNSLSQLILKLTVPGVPDLYQGQEEWQWTLVDPDNRHQIRFEEHDPTHPKQVIIRTLLNFRKKHSALFREGSYDPISVENGIGFGRTYQDQQILVFVDRFFAKNSQPRKIELPSNYKGKFTDLFTGEKVETIENFEFYRVLTR